MEVVNFVVIVNSNIILQLKFLKEIKSENIQTSINSTWTILDQQTSRRIDDSFASGVEYKQDGRSSDGNLVFGGDDFL